MSSSGGVFATYSATCLVLRVALARLPERLGPRRSVTAAFTFLGAGFAALAAIPQMWVLWASAGLLGAGVAFIYPSLMAMAVNGTPERERSRAVSSFTMFFEVGTAGGGLALGALADVAGKRSGFALAVGLCALGVWTLRAIALPRANVTAGRAVVGPTTGVRPARSLVAAAGD
jgi:MFS family permease